MTTTTVTLIPGENCCPFCLAEKAGSNPYGWLYFDCGTQYRPVLDDANRSVQCYERQLADTSHENALLTKALKFVQDDCELNLDGLCDEHCGSDYCENHCSDGVMKCLLYWAREGALGYE